MNKKRGLINKSLFLQNIIYNHTFSNIPYGFQLKGTYSPTHFYGQGDIIFFYLLIHPKIRCLNGVYCFIGKSGQIIIIYLKLYPFLEQLFLSPNSQ